MLTIASWNANPNREWFVRLSDAGANILVQLFLTKADAQAGTNLQASGNTAGFGANMPVTLTNDPGAIYPISLFQSTYVWHIRVSGLAGDSAKIFQLKAFVELEEINHPLFRNPDLIPIRAAAEIDAHTHARIPREIELGSHITNLEPGDVIRLNSSRRGKDEMAQVAEQRIVGELNDSGEAKLINTATIPLFQALRR